MIVVDASTLAEYLLDTPTGRMVGDRLLETPEIHIPHVASIEVASVIRGWVQAGRLDTRTARQALIDLAELPATRYPHEPLLGQIWELRDNVSAYDAAYVALAEVLDAPLLTCDARLSRAPLRRVRIELIG